MLQDTRCRGIAVLSTNEELKLATLACDVIGGKMYYKKSKMMFEGVNNIGFLCESFMLLRKFIQHIYKMKLMNVKLFIK